MTGVEIRKFVELAMKHFVETELARSEVKYHYDNINNNQNIQNYD